MSSRASSSISQPASPTVCPAALAPVAGAEAGAATVGTVVNVVSTHREALQYISSVFSICPVVSDTHGGRLLMRGVLAEGAWSVVYRVTEMVQRENFALKVIPQQGTHITSYYEDIRKLAKLRHPHIIKMHNHFVFEEDDSPFPLLCIRLELCNQSLKEHIQDKQRRQRPILIAHICTYVTQLASALAYIHRQGMLHGDICSANVLLAKGPSRDSMAVRLTNFGSSQRTVQPGDTLLTITGGCRAYAPPEWANSTTVYRPLMPLEMPLPSYDLWGLGCVLSEMATMKLLLSERLRHKDSLAADLGCLAALKEEMATVHEGTLAELCCGLLEVDPDERLSAESVPGHLPTASTLPASPQPEHGSHRRSHIPSLLRRLRR